MIFESKFMSPLKRARYQSFFSSLFIWLLGSIFTLFFIIFVAFLAVGIADYVYNANHPIPDPVVRGDDLGLGMGVIFWGLASVVISIPSSIFLFKFLVRKIRKNNVV